MRKVLGRIIALVAVIALSFTVTQGYVAKADANNVTVYVTIERSSLGKGLFLEPEKVVIPEGSSVADVMADVCNEWEINAKIDTTYGYYLTGIEDGDNDEALNIPEAIANMAPYTDTYTSETHYAPSNENNTGNDDEDLDEFDYSDTSGWMFVINNEGAALGANDTIVKDGDVIRLQFSVFGFGADLGIDQSYWGGPKGLELANKDKLIKVAAELWELWEISGEGSEGEVYSKEFDDLCDAIENHMLTQAEADEIYNNLEFKPLVEDETTTVAETTTATETTTVAESTTVAPSESATNTNKVVKPSKVKIKKVAKKKKSAKKLSVTLKKVKGAVGYQVAVFKSKKDAKKAKKMLAKKFAKKVKVTLKSKKLKNKKKLFVRARAYVLDNKTKVFGDWSAVKKVKVK